MDFTTFNNTINPSQPTTTTAPSTTLGKDDFLKLFVTQLQAQDPLNPTDSTEFTSQLAQFSSLEQLTNLNTGMTSMVQLQSSVQNALSVDLIGKQVVTDSGETATVKNIVFGSNGATLTLDSGTSIALSQIKQIGGN